MRGTSCQLIAVEMISSATDSSQSFGKPIHCQLPFTTELGPDWSRVMRLVEVRRLWSGGGFVVTNDDSDDGNSGDGGGGDA